MRKKGKWVEIHGYCTPGGDPVWCCSECGKGIHIYGIEHGTYGADISDGQWKACPNCGALMVDELTEDACAEPDREEMNFQDKKDFFNGYNRALLREKRLTEKVLEYRSRASSASTLIQCSNLPKGTSTRPVDDYLISLEEKISDLMQQKRRTDEVFEIIMHVIDELDPVDHDYLYLKYIKRKRNVDIGLRYRISRQSVYNAINRAINHACISDQDIEKIKDILCQ